MCKSRLSGGGGEGGDGEEVGGGGKGGGGGGEGEEGGGGGKGGGGGGQNLFVIMQSVRRLARSRVKTKWCVVLLRRPHPALQHLRPGLRAARYQSSLQLCRAIFPSLHFCTTRGFLTLKSKPTGGGIIIS